LSDDVFEKWLGCVTEPVVIAAQQECEARYLRAVKPKPASQNPDDTTIGKMMVLFLHHLTPPLGICIRHHHTHSYGGASCMNGHAKESGITFCRTSPNILLTHFLFFYLRAKSPSLPRRDVDSWGEHVGQYNRLPFDIKRCR
jgi:hypothetical protein